LYGKNPPFPQFLILSSQYNVLLMLALLLNYLKDLKLLNLFKSLVSYIFWINEPISNISFSCSTNYNEKDDQNIDACARFVENN
jgi:hypothetical protein